MATDVSSSHSSWTHLSIFHHLSISCHLLQVEKETSIPPADFKTLEAGNERLLQTSLSLAHKGYLLGEQPKEERAAS